MHYHLGMYGITNDEQPTTQTAAALFQELCYDNKDQLRWVRVVFCWVDGEVGIGC